MNRIGVIDAKQKRKAFLYYVTVKTKAWLLPPLSQPRSPERLAGVCTTSCPLPGAEICAVVIVICNCALLITVVGTAVPFHSTTEDVTKWLPFKVTGNPASTCANAAVFGSREVSTGFGLALPQKGLMAPHPANTRMLSNEVSRALLI